MALLKRFGISLFIIWGVLTLTFAVIHLAPGDPFSLYIRPDIDPQVVENMRRQMGFDLPLWKQYFVWITEFACGNFGLSFSHHRPVTEIFAEAIPNTLQLTIAAFLLQLSAGIVIGIAAALKHRRKIDSIINTGLIFLYSMPGFWLALMAVLLFSLKLGLLPSSQMASVTVSGGAFAYLADRISHLILPVIILALPSMAVTARFVRGSMIEALEQKYITAAKAAGLKKRKIIYRYALKNALLPVVTLIGMDVPFLLGGAVIIEYIFAWPGMGRITVDAIFAHDFPVILAGNFIAAAAVVAGNFLSDILYRVVDPRIRKADF